MKLFIQTSDSGGQIDGTVVQQLLKQLPTVDNINAADAVVVPVNFFHNYKFNEALRSIKQKIIVVDYIEYGWDFGFNKPYLLGQGIQNTCGHLNNEEYSKLDQWAKENPAVLTFKRELAQKDLSDTYKPAEFLCYWPAQRIVSKEEFDARPVEVFHCWGLSHPIRPKLHGEIFINAHDHAYTFVDNWNQKLEQRNWIALYSPHYLRVHMSQIMEWVKRSKICLSLPGAGVKCFRHSELVGSIMALPYDILAWSHDWIHGDNCIRLGNGYEFKSLLEATKRTDLYEIYLRAQNTLDKYRPESYVKNYIIPNIERVL